MAKVFKFDENNCWLCKISCQDNAKKQTSDVYWCFDHYMHNVDSHGDFSPIDQLPKKWKETKLEK